MIYELYLITVQFYLEEILNFDSELINKDHDDIVFLFKEFFIENHFP